MVVIPYAHLRDAFEAIEASNDHVVSYFKRADANPTQSYPHVLANLVAKYAPVDRQLEP